ncbi:Leucine-rich repeat containing protein [Entamoeba marina]
MSTLPKIYLANVVMYFDTVQHAQKFTLINKKCKDALEFLRINPYYISNIHNIEYPQNIFVYTTQLNKELILFPHLQTIRCGLKDYMLNKQLLESFSRVDITFIRCDKDFFSEALHNKLVHTTFQCVNCVIDLAQFVVLKRVSLILFNKTSLFNFFTDKDQKFDFVKISMTNYVDVQFLQHVKEFKFNKFVIELDNKESIDQVVTIPDIFDKVIVCSTFWYAEIDQRVIILSQNAFELNPNNITSYSVFDRYFPSCILFNQRISPSTIGIDLSRYTQINNLKLYDTMSIKLPSSITSFASVNIHSSLSQLKHFTLSSYSSIIPVQFPSTLTFLELQSCNCNVRNCKNLLLLELVIDGERLPCFDLCTTLTRLQFRNSKITTPCSHFVNLVNLSFERCRFSYSNINSFYPKSLQQLDIHTTRMLPLSLSLTKLTLSNITKKCCNLLRYSSLSQIVLKSTDNLNLMLPSTLECVKLDSIVDGVINLKQFNSINEVVISFCTIQTLLLPTSLKNFYCSYSSMNLMNIREWNLNKFAMVQCNYNYNLTHTPPYYYSD